MVSIINDSRVAFLVWFIIIALIIAAILILIEIRLKIKRSKAAARRRRVTPMDHMKNILARNGDVERKLDVVNKAAKNYFKEEYGISTKLDYSELAKSFKDRQRFLEVEFCEGMFESYYSDKKLTEAKVEKLGDILTEAHRRKVVIKKTTKVPGAFDKVDDFLEKIRDFIVGKFHDWLSLQLEKKRRRYRIKAQWDREVLNWVRGAIRAGHDDKKIRSLLKAGKRSRGEIREALKLYKKESKKLEESLVVPQNGIAQRILKREKERGEMGLVI